MSSYFCTECGEKVESVAKFCGSCGTPNASLAEALPPTHLIASQQSDGVASVQPVASPAVSQETPTLSPQAHSGAQPTMIMIAPTKSVGIAMLLTIFFGPLGMFYSTVAGGITMMIVTILIALVTFGFGVLVTWPICVIWAAIAANSHNTALVSATTR